MKILVIDNGTSYLSRLKGLLFEHTFKIIKYSEIPFINAEDFDLAILSGGHNFSVNGNETKLQNEINFIRNFPKPIFGICFGFEVIAYAFGAKLESMQKKEYGILDIRVVRPDEIFLNIRHFQVFESHRWIVKENTENLIVLAESKDGIEAIKHKTRPIYGVQFHPEMFVKKTCGDEIFQNFLNLISN